MASFLEFLLGVLTIVVLWRSKFNKPKKQETVAKN